MQISTALNLPNQLTRGAFGFNPASLFAAGEQGWWYDPSNMSTLFQDSAGTTPVTAMEQPVGLQLDLSKGLVLGPELVTNGTFDTDVSGWSNVTAIISHSTDEALVTSAGSFGYVRQFLTTVSGKTYIAKCKARRGTTNQAILVIVGGSQSVTTSISATTIQVIFVASSTSTELRLQVANAGTAFFDNITVRELPGNHRFQTTSANRPVVSARVNLLTKTEQFDNASWTKQSGTTVSSTPVAAPDGSLTAFTVSGNGASGIFQAVAGSTSLGQTIRAVYLRVTTGTATVGIKDPVQTQGITTCSLTTTWQRFTLTETTPPAGSLAAGIWIFNIPSTGIEIAWPDLRPTNIGVNLPAYQRVNTSTDYDSVGFPVYIKPNGSNQFMQTNSINFSSTDKMTVWQGVRKLSDAGTSVVTELSATINTNNGSFVLYAPSTGGGANYQFVTKGTFIASSTATGYAAPTTSVVTGLADIPSAVAASTIRVDGVIKQVTGATAGTGNFGNYPAYFYARAGTGLFFGGHDYGSIARGAASTAAQIANGETYINKLTKAFT
jgi:hypothetical protein